MKVLYKLLLLVLFTSGTATAHSLFDELQLHMGEDNPKLIKLKQTLQQTQIPKDYQNAWLRQVEILYLGMVKIDKSKSIAGIKTAFDLSSQDIIFTLAGITDQNWVNDPGAQAMIGKLDKFGNSILKLFHIILISGTTAEVEAETTRAINILFNITDTLGVPDNVNTPVFAYVHSFQNMAFNYRSFKDGDIDFSAAAENLFDLYTLAIGKFSPIYYDAQL